jgi:hypothetical protein
MAAIAARLLLHDICDFLQQHNISKEEIVEGLAPTPTGFIFNGDDFVWFEVQGKSKAVRWEFVERYELIESSAPIPN